MELSDLLSSQIALPGIPKVIALLLNELERQEPDLRKVTQLIRTDPVLTVRILQLANSAAFQLSGKINSVSEALAILNLGHVHAMATTAAASCSFKAVAGIERQKFWTYSLNVAKLSRSLAGVVRQNQAAAFTTGLIHAVGELTMHMGMPEAMTQLNRTAPPLDFKRAQSERKLFGFCYAEVGAGFARKWLFPQAIVDALEHQTSPFENDAYEPLAGVIHLASWRARAKEAGLGQRELAVRFPDAVGVVLGLDIDMVLQQDPIDWAAQSAGR